MQNIIRLFIRGRDPREDDLPEDSLEWLTLLAIMTERDKGMSMAMFMARLAGARLKKDANCGFRLERGDEISTGDWLAFRNRILMPHTQLLIDVLKIVGGVQ